MRNHDYSPDEALAVLMRKLAERDTVLQGQIQAAIDAGKDVEEHENIPGLRRRARGYRKTVRLTDEEALRMALDGLQAHFVEQPLFVISAARDFKAVAAGHPVGNRRRSRSGNQQSPSVPLEEVDTAKVLEIELQTETQISRKDQQTFRLEPHSDQLVEEQKMHVRRLAELIEFKEI